MENACSKKKLLALVCVMALLGTLFLPALAFADEPQGSQAEESAQATATTTVKVGYYESRNFQEGAEDGQPKSGYGYEYLQRIASYAGWHCEYEYGTWADLYEKLCNGEIDIMAGVTRTGEHQNQVLFPGSSMLNETFYLYKNSADESIVAGDTESYAGKTVGVASNSSAKTLFEEWLGEHDCAVNVKTYSSSSECLAAFERGEVQAFVSADNIVHDTTDIQSVDIIGREPYYLAISKSRSDLLAQVNKVVPTMNTLDRSFLVNLQSRYATDTSVSAYLSVEEQGWEAAHSTLTVGYLDNYLPYCDTDDDGSPTGFIVDAIPAIIDALPGNWSPEVTYQAFANQNDLLAALKNGEVDLAFPVGGQTWYAENEGYLRSSSVSSPITNLVVPEHYDPETVTSRIAVNRNNLMQQTYVKEHFPDAEIVEYDSIEECLEAVKSGKATGVEVNGLRASALLGSGSKLVAIQLPDTDDRCFGVALGNGPLLELVNRGIDIVGTDYFTNASYSYTKGLIKYTWQDFVRDNWAMLAAIAVLLMGVIAAFAAHRYRTLRKEAAHEAQMNKQLEEALQEAEKANHSKDMLLRNLSHDIRTPLNGILGAMSLNASTADVEQAQKTLAKAKEASRQLISLVDDLLEISTLRAGGSEAAEERFSVAEVLEGSVRPLRPFAQEAEVGLVVKEFSSLLTSAEAKGCSEHVRKIVSNLVDNAVRYNRAGGSVLVDAQLSEPVDGWATLTCVVKDTGMGMSQESVKRLCEPFYQADEGARSEYPGSGLGMAIVADLLRMMNGSMEISSVPGKGTTATVRIPLNLIDAADASDADAPKRTTVEGMRVLLAEDNELNREVAQLMLEQLGVEVTLACDGKEALETFKASEVGAFDAILMDLMMPVMDGLEATKAIRQLSRPDAQLPIIAATAKVTEEDRRVVFEAGMNAHIAKPLDPETLRAALLSC